MSALLSIQNIECRYRQQIVVRNLSFEVEKGSIVGLLGQSGCGKTTALRAIAGFEPVYKGKILLRSNMASQPGYMLAPEKRKLGMVFQDFALFPHLRVAENVGFGLRREGRKTREERVRELLELVGLEDAASSYPHELSGGQQQRVALARAMAPRPSILLMDEPFSSVDAELREQLISEIRAILLRNGMTAILVTHNQFEAFTMADRIGVFGEGRLRQWDTAYNLYHEPADRFVADFIGRGAMVRGRILDDRHVETQLGVIEGNVTADFSPRREVNVLLRPDDIVHDDESPLQLVVVKKDFRGAEYLYTLRVSDDAEVLCLVQSHHDHPVGETIGVRLNAEHLTVFART